MNYDKSLSYRHTSGSSDCRTAPVKARQYRPFSQKKGHPVVNFALTIGMLKLRRRLRSARPSRPVLDWAVLHVPIAPCLMGWRERIRR